ncbi:MAG: hypothetical protein SGPRY_013149, partial [Prymnesium sp.]
YPIVFGLKLTKAFFRPPPSGVMSTPNPDDPQSAEHGMHAMLLVGYMDREQVFIVRNSWGEGWGVGGYCYVPYDYAANPEFNVCGMYAIEGLDEVDLTPDDDDGEGLEAAEEAEEEDFDVEEEEEEDQEDQEEDDYDDDDFFSPLAEAKRVFDSFDADDSGSVDKRELFRALRLCGYRVRRSEMNAIMEMLDADDSGALNFPEFCRLLHIEAS